MQVFSNPKRQLTFQMSIDLLLLERQENSPLFTANVLGKFMSFMSRKNVSFHMTSRQHIVLENNETAAILVPNQLLVFSVTQFKIDQNKNRNQSIN